MESAAETQLVTGTKAFSSRLVIRSDWSEMDISRHINNVSIFKYVQSSRIHFRETVGLEEFLEPLQGGTILASVSCQFLKQLYYPGEVTAIAKASSLGHSSFTLKHVLFNEAGEICAEAEDVIVLFHYQTQQKLPLPQAFREKLLG